MATKNDVPAKDGDGGEPGKVADGGRVAAVETRTGPFSFLPTLAKKPAATPADSTLIKSREAVEAKRGRGRPPGSKTKAAQPDENALAQIERQAAELDKIFTPDNWRSIVRGPADLMLALSGRELWNLSEKEVAGLSVSASQTARYWMAIEPRYIVLIMFLLDVSVVYGGRAVKHIGDSRAEKKRDEKKTDG